MPNCKSWSWKPGVTGVCSLSRLTFGEKQGTLRTGRQFIKRDKQPLTFTGTYYELTCTWTRSKEVGERGKPHRPTCKCHTDSSFQLGIKPRTSANNCTRVLTELHTGDTEKKKKTDSIRKLPLKKDRHKEKVMKKTWSCNISFCGTFFCNSNVSMPIFFFQV